jgi:transaldolase
MSKLNLSFFIDETWKAHERETDMPAFKSNLNQTVVQFPTDYWNDSCSVEELTYAVDQGAVGATTNPVIVTNVLKKEMHLWRERINQIISSNPTWSETEITWKLIEEMAVHGASFLKPAFDRYHGKKGRLSIQTNPAFYRNADAIARQAVHFSTLAPNMQVKIPVTEAGINAIEEATYKGVSINATVCFTVPQAIAVAEAVERGLERRTASGMSIAEMSPVCTIMIGRTDDWMKVLAKRQAIDIETAYLDWAGIACLKKAYGLYQQRGYRARLLGAAYRHLGHWSELIGGDIILTIPYEWQLKINASNIEVKDRMSDPVDPQIVSTLYNQILDFRRAYDENGLTRPEFNTYGATVRTLRSFLGGAQELTVMIREFMLPNPDN